MEEDQKNELTLETRDCEEIKNALKSWKRTTDTLMTGHEGI